MIRILAAALLQLRAAQRHTTRQRSPHWEHVRAEHMREHPTCAACATTLHLEVHHIIPIHVRPDLELATSNLITLCEGEHHHHYTLGHGHDWDASNPSVVADAAALRALVPLFPAPKLVLTPQPRRPNV